MQAVSAVVRSQPDLAGRTRVFDHRRDAGRALAAMLAPYRRTGALVLGIAAGGVPVAAEIARDLELALEVAVVSKITPPWNSEIGYGAVAFDGSVRLNEEMIERLRLGEKDIERGIARTREKVVRRLQRLRAGRHATRLGGRTVLLVDDGLASGFTMTVAVAALRRAGAARVVVAIPTAHEDAAARVALVADEVVCANLRAGAQFAVADAYREWHDVSDEEFERALAARSEATAAGRFSGAGP